MKRYQLQYVPAPVDNPLKGLVPYAGEGASGFPHSLEFGYLPLSKLLVRPRMYDWKPLETLLNGIAGRGNQAVFRIYTEYPGQKDGLPPFLVAQGVKTFLYPDDDAPTSPVQIMTPDYSHPVLRKALQDFILELGRRYDGDPRVGFITAGLLGKWGEWHDYPREDIFAKKNVQSEIMDSYEKAFHKTPILLRYPVGESDPTHASNAKRNFGYHDDSFAWATLDTGKQGDDWFFVSKLKLAGRAAIEKWKSAPIGGEIRPEAWGKVFDAAPGNPAIQDFDNCVRETHASWLMDSGMFNPTQSPERVKRALASVRRMGYDFTVTNVSLNSGKRGVLEVSTEISNRGVAPFYYDWAPEFMLIEIGSGNFALLVVSQLERRKFLRWRGLKQRTHHRETFFDSSFLLVGKLCLSILNSLISDLLHLRLVAGSGGWNRRIGSEDRVEAVGEQALANGFKDKPFSIRGARPSD